MRVRKLLLIVVVGALAAWWWARDRVNEPTDAVPSERGAERVVASPQVDDAIANADERAEVAPIVQRVEVGGVERIKTVDEHDVALGDVELFVASASEPIKLGTTDENGVLVLSNALRGPARLRTRVSSELEQDHELPAGMTGTLMLHVDVGDSIRGVVTLPNGAPPPVEITVIAWNDDLGQDVRLLATQAMRGDRKVPQARTAANGTFTISRLRKGASYALAAGALGYMTKNYPARAIAGGSEITLVIQPVYVALVKFVDAETRGPVRVSPRLRIIDQVSAKLVERDMNVKPKIHAGADGILGGLDAELFAHAQDFGRDLHRHIQVCTNDSAPAHVGPFRLTVELPGYERATLDYFAEPLARGLHELELALVPTTHERGELAIRWKGVPKSLGMSVRPVKPWSTVTLARNDGRSLEYLIDDFAERELVLDEIPCGDYEVSVALQTGVQGKQLVEPMRSLRIGTKHEVIDVDVSQFGAFAVDVHRPDGSSYSGMLGIVIKSTTSSESGSIVAFWNAPYVVLGLKPSSWRVSLAKPNVQIPYQSVEVKAGELATLKFVLP